MSEQANDREWRRVLLSEIREIRRELSEFKQECATSDAEMKSELSALKVRAGLMGGLAGMVPMLFRAIAGHKGA